MGRMIENVESMDIFFRSSRVVHAFEKMTELPLELSALRTLTLWLSPGTVMQFTKPIRWASPDLEELSIRGKFAVEYDPPFKSLCPARLRTPDLKQCSIHGLVDMVAACPGLEEISVSGAKVDEEGEELEPRTCMHSLRVLVLKNSPELAGTLMKSFSFPQLQKFDYQAEDIEGRIDDGSLLRRTVSDPSDKPHLFFMYVDAYLPPRSKKG